jgi:hypothetical protein
MVSILNSVFIIMFHTARWSKLDYTYIYFKKIKSTKFTLYLYMLYLQYNKIYVSCDQTNFWNPAASRGGYQLISCKQCDIFLLVSQFFRSDIKSNDWIRISAWDEE